MPVNRSEISGLPCLKSSQSYYSAAKAGERDAARLYEQALEVFDIDDTSMLFVSVGHDAPVPTYVAVTHAA